MLLLNVAYTWYEHTCETKQCFLSTCLALFKATSQSVCMWSVQDNSARLGRLVCQKRLQSKDIKQQAVCSSLRLSPQREKSLGTLGSMIQSMQSNSLVLSLLKRKTWQKLITPTEINTSEGITLLHHHTRLPVLIGSPVKNRHK